MSRVERIGDATLYLGDCREILPALGKVDAVVTDIPYEIGKQSNGLRNIEYGEWDGAGASEIAIAVIGSLAHVPSVLTWCHWDQFGQLSAVLPLRSRRPLAWVKPNPTVMNGQNLFLPAFEVAYYGKLAGAWFGGNCVRSVWNGPAPQEREHPTQKPLDLMRWCIINTVPPDGTCLDPFMGSGTTGVACAKMGRKFIGIEIDLGYFDVACKRIEAAHAQPDMLIEKPTPAKQETFNGL